MGTRTAIGWTDATWNMIRARAIVGGKTGWHCEHKTAACTRCYAERLNMKGGSTGGTGFPYKPGHLGKDIELFLSEDALIDPLRWRRGRRIFPCSMTDLGADFVPDEWLIRIFAVMVMAHWHTFQVLTKRPERLRSFLSDPSIVRRIAEVMWDMGRAKPGKVVGHHFAGSAPTARIGGGIDGIAPWPSRNIWIGTSATSPDDYGMIEHLLHTPAALHFISAEPLLAPMVITPYLQSGIGWVITGGESGPDKRPMAADWARDLRDQCIAAGVPFFFKQWDGTKTAGNHLDGRLHEEFPRVA